MTDQITSNMVISAMKQIFAEHGIFARVFSNNGPKYSKYFKKLLNNGNLVTLHHLQGSPNRMVLSKDRFSLLKGGPVDWGCKIHRLHLCRSIRLPQRVSRI